MVIIGRAIVGIGVGQVGYWMIVITVSQKCDGIVRQNSNFSQNVGNHITPTFVFYSFVPH